MLEAAATSKREPGIPAKPFVTYDAHPTATRTGSCPSTVLSQR